MNDYRVAEWLDREELKVNFVVQRKTLTGDYVLAHNKKFETLDEAMEVAKMFISYREPIYHYVSEND